MNHQMNSFQKRLRSFKNWKLNSTTCTPENLAIVGFYLDNSGYLSTNCYYCSKTLEGWTEDEHPVVEHFTHKKLCPLFNLNTIKGRMATFKNWKNQDFLPNKLVREGFFMFPIKDSIPDEIFCFRCGINYNGFCGNSKEKEEILNHSNFCEASKKSGAFNLENKNDLFYIKLLKGELNEIFLNYLKMEICVPPKIAKELDDIFKYVKAEDLYLSIGEVIERCIKRCIDENEVSFQNGIDNVLNQVQNKFIKMFKEYQLKKKNAK